MVKINTKGQSGSNAAILIIVITVLIVLFILFLPPEDRLALLENNSASTSASATGQILLRESPGTLDYVSDDEKDYDFSAFTVSTEVRGEVIASRSSLYVKNSVFEKKQEAIQFTANPELTENLILSFNIEKAEGIIQVTLNGDTILNSELQAGNSPPIRIDSGMLEDNNELVFSVSSPGVAFWRYNEYTLKDIKVTADITDRSQSLNTQSLLLRDSDLANLKSAQLRYSPVCRQTTVSNLIISINGNSIFNGVPDCGTYQYLPIASDTLVEGQNRIAFSVDEGSILIDRLRITSTYETENNPVYYFEMEDANFTNPNDPDDYVLKTEFDAFIDFYFPNTNPKRFEVLVNGKKIALNTAKLLETRQIDNYLRPGTNSVEIKALQDMTMTQVRVRVKRV